MDVRSLIPFGRTSLARAGSEADPFTALRREMDRMFEDFSRDWGASSPLAAGGMITPRVDVVESEKGLEITAELPGVDQKDIQLDFADGMLTLKAERSSHKEERDEAKRYHVVERAQGTYTRRFALPFEADQDNIAAKFDNGVLTVFVPRSPDAAPPSRRIEITSTH